ncbi:MAG: dipeptidase [Pyrinomonadaceae bacterium]|nr:dipeptidase [Pyrinomonadaceae bacterium]MBP6213273.1 dipeptidase [Pyrinomonadaceae bacterium]
MKRTLKYLILIIGAALIAFVIFFFGFAAGMTERSLNPVLTKPPYSVSERAAKLHDSLIVADLHADALLWNRDLNVDAAVAQVDVPKLIRGNVAIQAFTVVTKTPRGLNIESNTDKTDNIFWLALSQRQPFENLFSLTKRALWQAKMLHQYASASGGKLVIVKNKGDVAKFIERRKSERIVGGWLGIEGAQALDGKPENVDVLFDAGFRMMSPSHFFDTEMGGSAHGIEKYGLTDKGREMVRRMETKGMFVDLAHSSQKTIDDVLSMATRPVVVSHTGVKGTCDNNRNLTDDQLRRIAATGGVVGIGFWDTAVCGENAASIARAIRYAVSVIGPRNVALGSDFDGSVKVPFDTSGEALITEALIAEGFSDDDIALIMGGNVVRLLNEYLPD